ncbi:MAG: hypothetical protein RJA49_2309 [Actinomycetota bacterium]
MSRGRRVAVCSALLGVLTLGGASTAFAHDPIILVDSQTTPDDGPLLPDGTISFALYGTLDAAGDTRGLRVHFDAGDRVDLTLLIPDLAPENALPDSLLPTLQIVAPDGTSRILPAMERVRFDESFSHTSYVRFLELREPAAAGEYRLTVTGLVAARFTLAIGTKEVFGTPVENVPNRSAGAAGVQRWYRTPPPIAATATTASATTTTVTTSATAPSISSTASATTTATATTAVDTDVGATSVAAQTTVAPAAGTSRTGERSSVLATVIGALIVGAAGLAWFLWQRRGRRDGDAARGG